MKQVFRALISLNVILSSSLYAATVQQQTPAESNSNVNIVNVSGRRVLIMPGQFPILNDETVIVADSMKFKVRVKIGTHEVQIGEPSDERPDIIRSACTYSRYPCSIVDYIDISVNDKPLWVPRSVFCDLADLNTAEVKFWQNEITLILNGGDASESYMVEIEFDAKGLKRRRILPSELGTEPVEPSEETTYHMLILKDE